MQVTDNPGEREVTLTRQYNNETYELPNYFRALAKAFTILESLSNSTLASRLLTRTQKKDTHGVTKTKVKEAVWLKKKKKRCPPSTRNPDE